MSVSDSDRIASYYDRLVNKYGHDSRACDAASETSLISRYSALSQVTDLSHKKVLEVGCGFGDLGMYLLKKYEGVEYVGIDISRRMIDVGRDVHPELSLEHADLMDLDIANQYDVVLAQGVFYLLRSDAVTKMRLMINKMFSMSKHAMAFSTISGWSPYKQDNELYADPVDLINWLKCLTPRLVFRHDYHPSDFAIYLYKQDTQSSQKESTQNWNPTVLP